MFFLFLGIQNFCGAGLEAGLMHSCSHPPHPPSPPEVGIEAHCIAQDRTDKWHGFEALKVQNYPKPGFCRDTQGSAGSIVCTILNNIGHNKPKINNKSDSSLVFLSTLAVTYIIVLRLIYCDVFIYHILETFCMFLPRFLRWYTLIVCAKVNDTKQ